ncbi:zinc ribbon domain-containing protein [Shewanella sp. GXUN23E]|uniref:zinc ribbon domain-containing protein n=1 Tax=Shewanella sp. GXUN23E TaxID=3422498 RepID=UPI003D7C5D93
MALIECPVCSKRISSVAKECQHCHAKLDGNLESMQRISHIKRSQNLMNQSFLAMTLFIAGMVIWFWGGEPAEGTRAIIAGICFVVGFVGYLICRVQMVLHKRKSV